MKAHTNLFKEKIKEFGREIDSKITYTLNNEEIELGNEDLNSVSLHYEGGILKSVMKQLDIDSNVEIPLETILTYEFGVKVGNEYEYINYGNFVVYKVEKQEDTSSYKITCYDKMLYSMKDYVNMNLIYPITIRNYIIEICDWLGLDFANTSDTFANYDKAIPNELYLDDEGNSLGYTFRDVLDELAEVTASTICINDDDELEIRYITDTEDTIDEEYLKDVNVNFGETFGPINVIVLSRSAGSDNIYYPAILPENPKELKISDNQIMNGNDRDIYLAGIYNKLNGLTYMLNDYSSTGICYYDVCDRYNVQIGENTYSCVMFNDEINITQGLEEKIYTDLPEETVTDYTKADTTDRRINQVSLIVDKQAGVIQSLVDNTTYISDTKTGIGSITLENANEGQLYKLTIKGNISLLFPQDEELYGHAIAPHDGLEPGNLVPSSPVPYENDVHYPSDNLFSKNTNLIIDDTTYELDFDFLNYMSTSVCDEFVYENGTCYIIRRVGIDENGDMFPLQSEVIEPRKGIILNVKADSTITLPSFPSAILSSTYLLENIFTDSFATEAYVQSNITQTAESITEQVNAKVGDDEIIAKLNIAVQDGQGIINLTGNAVTIDSDNFTLDAEGNATMHSGTIDGGNIELFTTGDTEQDFDPKLIIHGTGTANPEWQQSAGRIRWENIYCYITSALGRIPNTIYSITNPEHSFYGSKASISAINVEVSDGTYRVNITSQGIEMQKGYDVPIKLNNLNGNVTCVSLTQTSKEEDKKNFEKLENALEIIKNTDIYKYNFKDEKVESKKHIGFVIGDKYKYRKELTSPDNDGVDVYALASVCLQAIKEQQKIIEDLQQRIEKLERESDK